jgi:acetyl-CoA carboxylase biotin carboxyl carrier protein
MSSNIHTIKSPLMGTFYRASAPEAPPLAEVGQQIEAGHVVCIIESMKVFTELRTDKGGVVKSILVENEDPVMKNQDLIEIEVA